MKLYKEVIEKIQLPCEESKERAKLRLDNLIKPLGSLGKLEEISIKIAGITGKVENSIGKKCVIIMAADNGISEERVSSVPKEVTVMQTLNFTKGGTGINVLAEFANSDIVIVDIGIDADVEHPKVLNKKIRRGTDNITKKPAMTKEEAIKALETGMEVTINQIENGYNLIGTGEMGIGNTSTSSAVAMTFLGCSADLAVGKGAGLTNEDHQRKKNLISRAIEVNSPDKEDPIDVVSKVGGFDIAGMAGCFLGAAYKRTPVVVDGVISAAAALIAYKINPLVRHYMIPSHMSAEPAYNLIMKELELTPSLNLGMRLGEGTGCPLMFSIIEAALSVTNNMATFEQVSIDDDFLIDIR